MPPAKVEKEDVGSVIVDFTHSGLGITASVSVSGLTVTDRDGNRCPAQEKRIRRPVEAAIRDGIERSLRLLEDDRRLEIEKTKREAQNQGVINWA